MINKKIVSVFIILTLLAPVVVGAQTVAAQNQQLTALINQTIALIQQLILQLTAQLNELQAAESAGSDQATTTEEIITEEESTTEEIPVVTIENEGLVYRFNAPGLEDKYLVDLKMKAKKNFLKATLSYYTYSSDDSTNRVQTTKIIRSIDNGEIVELNDVKYSIELRDINNRQVQIREWFDITEASGTSSGETITVGF